MSNLYNILAPHNIHTYYQSLNKLTLYTICTINQCSKRDKCTEYITEKEIKSI